MDTNLINNFYDKIGYISAYSVYPILFFFLINPAKIRLSPFYYFFINLVLSVIFDTISLALHEKQSTEAYINFILPFYAINNILFIGFFLSYYVEYKFYLRISTIVISFITFVVYHLNGYLSWSTWGSLIQAFTMIFYLVISLKNVYLSRQNILNRKPVLYIIVSLLGAYTVSLIVNLLHKSMIEESRNISNLFYGIKNVFWIISNFLSAYAVYKIVVKPKLG
jgi:hypothetical protein